MDIDVRLKMSIIPRRLDRASCGSSPPRRSSAGGRTWRRGRVRLRSLNDYLTIADDVDLCGRPVRTTLKQRHRPGSAWLSLLSRPAVGRRAARSLGAVRDRRGASTNSNASINAGFENACQSLRFLQYATHATMMSRAAEPASDSECGTNATTNGNSWHDVPESL